MGGLRGGCGGEGPAQGDGEGEIDGVIYWGRGLGWFCMAERLDWEGGCGVMQGSCDCGIYFGPCVGGFAVTCDRACGGHDESTYSYSRVP